MNELFVLKSHGQNILRYPFLKCYLYFASLIHISFYEISLHRPCLLFHPLHSRCVQVALHCAALIAHIPQTTKKESFWGLKSFCNGLQANEVLSILECASECCHYHGEVHVYILIFISCRCYACILTFNFMFKTLCQISHRITIEICQSPWTWRHIIEKRQRADKIVWH